MKPARIPPKHETVLKELRHERTSEDQRIYKLQMKIVEKLSKSGEIKVA